MALTAKKVYAILKRQISDMEAKLNSPVRYKGTVATADLLPLNPDIGDMYNIESKSIYGEAGMNVAWNGVVWDTMGAPIDMSLYLTKEGADTTIQNMVNEYLEKNPVKPGATTEQAQQIEQNKTDVASLKEETGSLREDIVSYNIDKILTLEETYSAKKPTAINYIKCTNVSNEYSDAMYAFKNNGDVSYSGPRFTLKEKQKLFCVVVLSSNTAYTEQTQAILTLTDQQDNINRTKSIGNLENNQVLTLIGADDASLFPWAVLNGAMNSSTITKIKYIGFFDFKNYSAIMSDIIN